MSADDVRVQSIEIDATRERRDQAGASGMSPGESKDMRKRKRDAALGAAVAVVLATAFVADGLHKRGQRNAENAAAKVTASAEADSAIANENAQEAYYNVLSEQYMAGRGQFGSSVDFFEEADSKLPEVKDANGNILGRMLPHALKIPKGTSQEDRQKMLALGTPFTLQEIADSARWEIVGGPFSNDYMEDDGVSPLQRRPWSADDMVTNYVKIDTTPTPDGRDSYASPAQYDKFIELCGMMDEAQSSSGLPTVQLEFAVYQGIAAEASNQLQVARSR